MKYSFELHYAQRMRIVLALAMFFLIFDFAHALCSWKVYYPSNKTIYIQNPLLLCSPVAELQLIENTDVCLTNCHAIIRVKLNFDIQLPDFANDGYKFNFQNGNIRDWKVQIGENVCTNVDDYSTICNYTTTENGTQIPTNCTQVVSGSHQECKIQYGNFFGKKLLKGVDYYILISATKDVRDNVEWIPTFYTLDLKEWAWWNSSFQRRKQINITNSGTSNLTDYQVFLNITYDSDMQSDFKDIRFTYYNQTTSTETEIPFWIENQSNSNWAYVWVKVPFIRTSSYGNETIYIYYKNTTTVSSASNGQNTFNFFDDFEGTTLNTTKWTATGTGSYTISNSQITLVNKKYITSTNTFTNNYALRVKVKVGTDTSGFMWATFTSVAGEGGNIYLTAAIIRDSAASTYKALSGDGVGYDVLYYTTSIDTLYHTAEARRGTTNDKFKLEGESSELTGNHPTSAARYIELHAETADLVSDWVLVRKYASPEPTYSIGAEETVNVGEVDIISPTNSTYYIATVNLNYTVKGSDSSYPCWQKLDSNSFVYDGEIANNTYYNTTLSNLSSSLHSINITCYSTLLSSNFSNITYFTVVTGLNLSVQDYYNNSFLSGWSVDYSNGTTSGTLSCSSYSCILNSNAVSGSTTLTISKSGYKTNITTYTISTTQLENYIAKLIIYDNFWLKDTISNTYLQSWSMNMTNGTLQQYSTSGYYIQIAHDELLRGTVSIRAKKNGYTDNTTTITVNDTSYYNLTLNVQSVNLTLFCKDEYNNTDIYCNYALTNLTSSVYYSNVMNVSMYISTLPIGTLYINVKNDSYTERTYFLELSGNESVNLTTYILSTDKSTLYAMYVKKDAVGAPNAIITFYKFINDSYKKIGQALSDSQGSFTMYLNHVTQYRVEITYQGQTYYFLAYPVDGYTFNLPSIIEDIKYMIMKTGVTYQAGTTNKVITCNVTDPQQIINRVVLQVNKTNGDNLCSYSGNGTQTNLTCDLSSSTEIVNVVCYADILGYKWIIYKEFFDWREIPISERYDKLLISFFALGTITITLLFIHPVFAIMGLIVTLLGLQLIQFIIMPLNILLGLALVGGIIIYLVKD